MREPDALQHNPQISRAALAVLHEPLFGWAMSRCGYDRSTAEDLMQQTYVELISGKARFDAKSSLRTFVFSVVQNLARGRFRRRAVRLRVLEQQAVMAEADAAQGLTAQNALALNSGPIWDAVNRLPDRQRDVVELVFCREFTVAEAADVMGVTTGTARVHYDRAKKALRQTLAAQRSEWL